MAVFIWTNAKSRAAELLAADHLTDKEIAAEVKVTPQTLWNWKNKPEFAARIESHAEKFRRDVRSRGIAIPENRVNSLDDRWRRMRRVIAERAESKEMAGVPGGTTGLLCHTVKGVGRGDDFQLIDLYEVDTGLLKELREHEKQAAQELGQWTEKPPAGDRIPIQKIVEHPPPDREADADRDTQTESDASPDDVPGDL